ncbi:MAG: sulfurtransferase TusA family protein [Calditrichaeota bacterium]|nr:MAG: sulfurtransferase TusA family protein [Calditrichota bacterium]
MSEVQANMELDCRGLNCPLPILKTKKAIESLNSGDVLKMVATDPGSINDMNAWSKRTGNELLSSEQTGDEYVFFIRKK